MYGRPLPRSPANVRSRGAFVCSHLRSGSTNSIDQTKWSAGTGGDYEQEHDGREPDADFGADPAERGIGDLDGALEQYPGLTHGNYGERVE